MSRMFTKLYLLWKLEGCLTLHLPHEINEMPTWGNKVILLMYS